MTPLLLTGSIAQCEAAKPNGGTGKPSAAAKGVAAAAAGQKANSPKRAARVQGRSAKGAAAGASGKAAGRRGAVQAEKGDGKFTFLVALALEAMDKGTNGIPVSPRPGAEIKRPQAEAAEAVDIGAIGIKAAGIKVAGVKAVGIEAVGIGAAGIEVVGKGLAGGRRGPDAKVHPPAAPGQVDKPQLPALAAGKSSAAAVVAEGPKPQQTPATGVEAPEGKPHSVAMPKAGVVAEQAGPAVEAAARPAEPAEAAEPGDPQQAAATAVARAMSVANGSQPGPTDAKATVFRRVGRPGGGVQAIEGRSAQTPQQAPASPPQVLRQAARVDGQTPSLKEVTVTGKAAADFGAAVRTAIDAAGQPAAGVETNVAAPAEQAARTPTTDVHQPQAVRQAGPISESVAQQIAAQVRTEAGRASQRVVIQLQPPELGRVRVTFRESGGELHGELKFSDPEALAQARVEAPVLIRQLAAGGVRVRQLDITLEADGPQQQLNGMGRDGQRQGQQAWGEAPGEADQDAAGSEEPPGDPLAELLRSDPEAGSAINLWV